MKLLKTILIIIVGLISIYSCKSDKNTAPSPVGSSGSSGSEFYINATVNGISHNCDTIITECNTYEWCGYSTQTNRTSALSFCDGFNKVSLFPVFYGDTLHVKNYLQLYKKYRIYSNLVKSYDSSYCPGNMTIQYIESLNGPNYWGVNDKDTTQSYVLYNEFTEAGHYKEGATNYKVYITAGEFKAKVRNTQDSSIIKPIEGSFRFKVKLSR